MNIVLVSIGNFQDYILSNIKQLLLLGHTDIYVITNKMFFHNFPMHEYNSKQECVKLIECEGIRDTYQYSKKSRLDASFRDGFWQLASARLFIIHDFMKQYNIENVIHLENDVLVYYNCNVLAEKVDTNKIYIPFDCYERNIASIMFIPNYTIFSRILDNYNYSKNDMENFVMIKKTHPELIELFPIFINDKQNNNDNENLTEEEFVSSNFHIFQYIFDAAAIGQYIGGVDPRNMAGDTSGFVNETCVIKYNEYEIQWKEKTPFLIVCGNTYPIFNLHIHCKNLEKFICYGLSA